MRVTQLNNAKTNENVMFRKKSVMDRDRELEWLKKLA